MTTRRLMGAILFVGLFAMATRVSVAADTWWHIRAGQWMIEQRALLDHDVFSHTRAGQPWINHSWLSQLPLYLSWAALGYAGPNLLVAVLVVVTFAFVYCTCEGGEYLRAFVVVLAAAASGVYWSARPQLASLLLAAVFSWVLYRFRRDGVNRLWLLIPLMALWVNLHGGFVIGFILLALTVLGEGVKLLAVLVGLVTEEPTELARDAMLDRWLAARVQQFSLPPPAAQPALQRLGWIALVGVACAAVVPLNPYGPRMWLYPLETVSIGVLQDFIQEWQSPNFHLIEAQVFIWLLLATVAAIGFSRRVLDITDFLLLAGFSYLSLLAGRNIAVFAVVAAPVLARHVNAIVVDLQHRFPALRTSTRPLPLRLARLNWALLGFITLAALLRVAVPLAPATNEEALVGFQPVAAAAHLRATSPQGRMFNSYNWGGYLIWALYPDTPVYVDGRTDLYEDAFLREYLDVVLARPGWRETLDEYEIDFVLIETGSVLASVLEDDADWRVDYQDDVATVFVRA